MSKKGICTGSKDRITICRVSADPRKVLDFLGRTGLLVIESSKLSHAENSDRIYMNTDIDHVLVLGGRR